MEVILIIDKDKIDALKGAKLQGQIDVYRLPPLFFFSDLLCKRDNLYVTHNNYREVRGE